MKVIRRILRNSSRSAQRQLTEHNLIGSTPGRVQQLFSLRSLGHAVMVFSSHWIAEKWSGRPCKHLAAQLPLEWIGNWWGSRFLMIICSVSSSGFIAVSLFRAFSASGVSFCSPCLSFYQCRKKPPQLAAAVALYSTRWFQLILKKVQWVMKTYAEGVNPSSVRHRFGIQ